MSGRLKRRNKTRRIKLLKKYRRNTPILAQLRKWHENNVIKPLIKKHFPEALNVEVHWDGPNGPSPEGTTTVFVQEKELVNYAVLPMSEWIEDPMMNKTFDEVCKAFGIPKRIFEG